MSGPHLAAFAAAARAARDADQEVTATLAAKADAEKRVVSAYAAQRITFEKFIAASNLLAEKLVEADQ